ncbi:MAG: DMT family transporter [Anaerolineales bacterium]|nr:DMT family transporter [Anaerolineales bacterium]MCK5633849.1 DMT family transporter [Anaerolineales bacterium]
MQRRTLAILAGLLLVIFWGASFIAIKIALKQAQPITLIVIRLGIGLCVLYPIAWMRGELRGLSLRDHAIMILLGVVGLAGHQWLQAEGMLSADATTATWLAALAPAFMVILASFFLQERTTPGQVAGLGLALLGALLVAMRNEGLEIGRGDWVGPAFEFGDRMGCVFHCWKSCFGKMLASSGCGIDYDLGLAIQPLFIAGQWRLDGSNCVPT